MSGPRCEPEKLGTYPLLCDFRLYDEKSDRSSNLGLATDSGFLFRNHCSCIVYSVNYGLVKPPHRNRNLSQPSYDPQLLDLCARISLFIASREMQVHCVESRSGILLYAPRDMPDFGLHRQHIETCTLVEVCVKSVLVPKHRTMKSISASSTP